MQHRPTRQVSELGINNPHLLVYSTCMSAWFYTCTKANITHHVNVDMGQNANKQHWENVFSILRAPPLKWKTEFSSLIKV